MKIYTDVMIDLETLDTKPSSIIASIGAVAFNPRTGAIDEKGFYSLPKIQTQIEDGRSFRIDTLKWWLDQGEKVYSLLKYSDNLKLDKDQALNDLGDYIKKQNGSNTKVWSNGSTFDIMILEDIYDEPPFKFWNVRDLRTLYEISGKYPESNRIGTHHNALDDALHQAKGVIWAYKKLGLSEDENE